MNRPLLPIAAAAVRVVTTVARIATVATMAIMMLPSLATAQIVVSANDAKVKLVDGVNTVVKNPPPDTVTILDLRTTPPKIVGELKVPNSVVGPPQNVALSPDESIAIVTSSNKIDPADPGKTAPDDRVTVIDLKASPPSIITTLHAGAGASGVSINRAGTMALVANRGEGTVSVFAIKGKTVTADGKVTLSAPDSGPSGVAFSADGRLAFVTRNNDNLISVLSIDGATVEYRGQTLEAGLKPYGIEVSAKGDVAVVGNIGAGATGAPDTLSVIDITANTPRAVAHVTVGPTAEGVSISPDGRFVAVTVMNGSNSPKSSPQFHEFGLLKILSLDNKNLTPVTDAKIGVWCQGVAWSADSRTILVQCMVEQELQVFSFDGKTLTRGTAIKVTAGPAGIRTAQR
jgi:DNA-binding beta-propeller fold protein YncE